MCFTTLDVARKITEFIGVDPPCCYNDNDERLPDWCEENCGSVTYEECWVKFIDEGII